MDTSNETTPSAESSPLASKKEAPNPPDERSGAHSAGEGNDDFDELPMIVWLKGDEPYCEQFVLDADEAMKHLGIKRSRLTQISGRELRVGRIRSGRYIKPIYRTEDILAYKNWTRATASHVRSSTVLKEAADELNQRQEELFDRITESLDQLNHDVERQLSGVTEETYNIQRDQFQELTKKVTELVANPNSSNQQSDEILENLQMSFLESIEAIRALEGDLAEDLRARIEQLRAEQLSSVGVLQIIQPIVESISNKVDHVAKSSDESYELIFDGIAQLKTNFDSLGRFNGRLAEALAKVIECQRESMLASQNRHLQLTKLFGHDKSMKSPAAIQNIQAQRRALKRKLAVRNER